MVGHHGPSNSRLSLEFVTGYLIELSLSVDNLFVFLLLFRYFHVPRAYQHTVLFWGVIGALVMRAIFIAAGVALLNRFHWVIYIFGAILIYSGVELMRQKNKKLNPEANLLLRGFRKLVPRDQGLPRRQVLHPARHDPVRNAAGGGSVDGGSHRCVVRC